MKIAVTAAEAAVDEPKTNRNSRNQATWNTSAAMPEKNTSAGISRVGTRGGEPANRPPDAVSSSFAFLPAFTITT